MPGPCQIGEQRAPPPQAKKHATVFPAVWGIAVAGGAAARTRVYTRQRGIIVRQRKSWATWQTARGVMSKQAGHSIHLAPW